MRIVLGAVVAGLVALVAPVSPLAAQITAGAGATSPCVSNRLAELRAMAELMALGHTVDQKADLTPAQKTELLKLLDACTQQAAERSWLIAMKSDLRNLVTTQEAFFADSNHYAKTVDLLHFVSSTGVGRPQMVVGPDWWRATVTSTIVHGVTCAIAINTKNSLDSSAGEGEPICR